MSRNEIGRPPTQSHDVHRPSDEYKASPDAAAVPEGRHHPGMDPGVEKSARVGDTPAGDQFARPITERVSNANLYIAIMITVVIAIVFAMLMWAFAGG